MECLICAGPCAPAVRQGPYCYWRCRGCRTAQLAPQPPAAELDAFYETFHAAAAEGGSYEAFEARMQADFPAKLRLVRAFAPTPGARLLDVGCGKGFFVQTAQAAYEAEGIDLSARGVEYATRILKVKATAGRLEKYAELWQGRFDVVTFWATVEHLPDPRATLRAIASCLKPGGLLVCDTGLGDAPWEAFLPGHSQWYDAPQHLFVFSREGLGRLLSDAGFEVLHWDTNFERSRARRWLKWARHASACLSGYLLLRPLLGRAGLDGMRAGAKWPLGRLLSVVARKGEGQP